MLRYSAPLRHFHSSLPAEFYKRGVEIEPTTVALQLYSCTPAPRRPQKVIDGIIKNIYLIVGAVEQAASTEVYRALPPLLM